MLVWSVITTRPGIDPKYLWFDGPDAIRHVTLNQDCDKSNTIKKLREKSEIKPTPEVNPNVIQHSSTSRKTNVASHKTIFL